MPRHCPSATTTRGSTKIPLYTDDDLARLRDLVESLTAGRKPKDHDYKMEMDSRANAKRAQRRRQASNQPA